MSEVSTLFAADDGTLAFICHVLARADEAWARRSSPAPVIQSLFGRLDPNDPEGIRRAVRLCLSADIGGPEARAMVAGGIRARFEESVGADESLRADIAAAYESWPLTARILHVIRLLRAPPGSGPMPEDMLAPIAALVAASAEADALPFEMRLGFLQATAGSDRLPAALRDDALAAADGLVLRTQMQVPPSILLRAIARSAAATRKPSPAAWARACIAAAGIAGRLSHPALVHMAALALFRETGVGLGGAHALLRDAAAASPGWHAGSPLETAFATATTAQDAGMLCRGLLVRPAASRARTRPKPSRDDAARPEVDPRARTTRTRAGSRLRADPATTDAPEAGAPLRPSLAERHGGSPADTDAGMRAATRRAAARLLNRLRLKNAAKDTPPG